MSAYVAMASLALGIAVLAPAAAHAAPMVDGMLDSTFGTAGFVRFSPTTNAFGDIASDLVIDSSGRMLIAGESPAASGTALFLTRLDASGAPDTTFGSNGTRVITSPDALSLSGPDIVIDATGRLVVSATAQTSSRQGFFVARFTATGQPDATFGTEGQVLDVSIGTSSQAAAVVIASSGHIVVAGSTPDTSQYSGLAMSRYTSDGILDTSFGDASSGTVVDATAPPVTTREGLTLDATGRIVVVGRASGSDFQIGRFSGLGDRDDGFGNSGSVIDQFSTYWSTAFSIRVDSLGRILVSGCAGDGCRFGLGRYTDTGAEDWSFGSLGSLVDNSLFIATASTLLLEPNGDLLVAGAARNLSGRSYALMRVSSSGQAVTSYGPSGLGSFFEQVDPLHQVLDAPPALALDSQGRAVIAASALKPLTLVPEVVIARYATADVAGAPSAVEAEQFWEGELVVAWDPATMDGGTPITGYVATASPGGATCTTDATPGDKFCFIDGLTTGVSYTVSVKAVNRAGTGPAATSAAVTPVWIPDEPTNVSVTPSPGGATVSWVAPTDTGSLPITGYVATAMPGGATCSTTATSCTFSGLIGGTTYTFWVYANNSLGEGYDSEDATAVILTTLPIAAPLTPQAPPPAARPDTIAPLPAGPVNATGIIAPDGTVGATLNWALPGDSDVASVRLGIKEGAGIPTSTDSVAGITVALSRTGATLSRLRPGATYTVAVYTLDAAGNMAAGVTTTLAGSRARGLVPATSTAGQAIPLRLTLLDISNKPLPRRPVEVLVRAAGARAWRVHSRALTNARGEVLVSARPTTNTQFALRYVGGPGALGVAAGGVATVRVRSSVSSLLTVGSRAGVHLAPRRGVARLSGAVAPGKRSAPVYLQKLVGRTWRNVAMTRLDTRGRYAFILATARPGTSTYRVYRPADTTNLAGASAGQVLSVR